MASNSIITINPADLQQVGQNVSAGMVNGVLVLVVDPKANLGPSSTGKMIGVANTGGFTLLPAGLRGNIYIGRKACL